MHRPGSDPANMRPDDFLCDFCERPWSETTPFIEGHHGSCICGACLTSALLALRATGDHAGAADASGAFIARACTMCLEERAEAHWSSPRRVASICARCIEQASRVLARDRSSGWTPPL